MILPKVWPKDTQKKYSNLVIRLGGFHIAENFLGAIGFFMKESGFENVLVESKICGKGTANKIISGKGYYQMLNCHFLMSEAIVRLKWEAFESWLIEEGLTECFSELAESINALLDHLDNQTRDTFTIDAVKTSLRNIREQLHEFENSLGPTAQYWSMYVEMVQILRCYIHAERSGCWQAHLTEVENMIPYITAAGYRNYAVCLPLYLHDMKALPESSPAIHEEFMQGHFAVHRTPGSFNGIWTDLAIEQTYNRDGKISILKGILQSLAAREKYIKTAPLLTAVSEQVRSIVHMNTGISAHHGDSDASRTFTEAKVNDIIYVVTRKMINPFVHQSNELVNVSSGEVAPSKDIIRTKEIGIAAIEEAKQGGKLKLPKLATFATQKLKKKQSKSHDLAKVYRHESMVTRGLYFVQGVSDNIRLQAFSHEWTNYPASLFDPDYRSLQGFSMRKGTKAEFLSELYKFDTGNIIQMSDNLNQSELKTVYVIDAMAFIKRFRTLGSKTFIELTLSYLHKMMELKHVGCDYVHFVGDRYDVADELSLKEEKRLRRCQS